MSTLKVDDLIKALQAIPNPSATDVTVDDSAGVNLTSVDITGATEEGIDGDGGTVDLVGGA